MQRIIGSIAVVMLAQTALAGVLFSDSFDRNDNRNIDASLSSIIDNTGSSLAADGVYTQPFVDAANDVSGPDGNPANGGGAQILSGQLELADGPGTSNAYINHNFTNGEILTDGGFSVIVDMAGLNQSSAGQGGGFAIGMSSADADATGDAWNAPTKFTDALTGSGNTDTSVSVADFWLVLRGNGTLVWGGVGNSITADDQSGLLGNMNVGSKTGTIRADFTFSSFDAGETVNYEVFYNGASQGSGSFQWDESTQNYIGLDARDSQGVFFDSLSIATIPEPASLVLVVIGGLVGIRRR